jgi:hypothetical protein
VISSPLTTGSTLFPLDCLFSPYIRFFASLGFLRRLCPVVSFKPTFFPLSKPDKSRMCFCSCPSLERRDLFLIIYPSLTKAGFDLILPEPEKGRIYYMYSRNEPLLFFLNGDILKYNLTTHGSIATLSHIPMPILYCRYQCLCESRAGKI